MAIKEYNVDLDIKGRVLASTVPNSTGSIITWNSSTNVFGTRTNAQIIADLGLQSSLTQGNHINITGNVISVKPTINTYIQDSANNNRLLFGNTTATDVVIKGAVANGDFKIKDSTDADLLRINGANKVPYFPQLPAAQTGDSNLAVFDSGNGLWKHSTKISDLVTTSVLNAGLATKANVNGNNLTNIPQWLTNLGVYSTTQVDGFLAGKANTSGYYPSLSAGLWNTIRFDDVYSSTGLYFLLSNGSGVYNYTDVAGMQSALGINTSWDLQQVVQNGHITNLSAIFNGIEIGYTTGSYKGFNSDKDFAFLLNYNDANRILTGGLLASDNYADASLIPTNGIHSKGNIHTYGDIIGYSSLLSVIGSKPANAHAIYNTDINGYGLNIRGGSTTTGRYALQVQNYDGSLDLLTIYPNGNSVFGGTISTPSHGTSADWWNATQAVNNKANIDGSNVSLPTLPSNLVNLAYLQGNYYAATHIDSHFASNTAVNNKVDRAGDTMFGSLNINVLNNHIQLSENNNPNWHIESVSGEFNIVETGVAQRFRIIKGATTAQFNGFDMWHAGNFNPSNYALANGTNITNLLQWQMTLGIGLWNEYDGTTFAVNPSTGMLYDSSVNKWRPSSNTVFKQWLDLSAYALTSQIPTNNNQLTNGAGYITAASLPTVNNGTLSMSVGTGLSGSATFTANQAGNSTFTVDIASTHKLPTTAEWNALPTTNTITRLRGTASGTFTSGDLTLLAGSNIAIAQSGTNFTITAANTTYSAGTGLSLTGTTFGQTITTSGTGTFVTGITQTANGFQVNLGTPPNTVYTAGTGISIASNVITNSAPNATHTGDVTGATALTIANGVVTNAKMANMGIGFKGRNTGTGAPMDLTVAQAQSMLGITTVNNGIFIAQGDGVWTTGSGSTSANASANTSSTITLTQTTIDTITAGVNAGNQITSLFGDCQVYFAHQDVSAGGFFDTNEAFYNLFDPYGATPTVVVANHHVHGARLILHSYGGVGFVTYKGEFMKESVHTNTVYLENGKKSEFTWNEDSQVWVYVLPD